MELQITTWNEASKHLEGLARTVVDDLFPLLDTRGYAPHTIAREFSCYVDYLGTLYTGLWEHQKSRDRYIEYLQKVLALVHQGYCAHAEIIHAMYRNGPVHEFDPKTLEDPQTKKQLTWASFARPDTEVFPLPGGMKQTLRHLERATIGYPPGNVDEWLPVSSYNLLHDLLQSIWIFKDGIGNLRDRVINWNRAAQNLSQPFQFQL